MRRALVLLLLIGLFGVVDALAQMEIVEMPSRTAKALAGIVTDPSGAPLEGVLVEERSSNWANVLRSTKTDAKGLFHFSSTKKQNTYYLQFGRTGFNWARLTVKVHRHGEPKIMLQMPIGT